jgi:polyhydroxyalkanoate synthesis regulator phasin
MLAKAVEQEVITEAEAAVFAEAHTRADRQMALMREDGASGGMDEMMPEILATLVASGDLSQEQADTFLSVHDRLGEAGLMR